jgi:hypothetical protein
MTGLLVDKVLVHASLTHLRDASATSSPRGEALWVVETTTFGKTSKHRSWLVLTKLSCWLGTPFLVIDRVPPCFRLVVLLATNFQDFFGRLGQEDVLLPVRREMGQETGKAGVGTPKRILGILYDDKKKFVITQQSIRSQAKLHCFVVDESSV